MGTILFIRKTDTHSFFRRALFSIIECPGAENIIIGSGYFQELPNRTNYSASEDDLKDVLNNSNIKKVYVLGCMSSSRQNMRTFINNIRAIQHNGNPRFQVEPSRRNFSHWHAKFSLVFDNQHRPLAILIGSSNLTRRAYGENNDAFNVEADALIWCPGKRIDNHFKRYAYKAKIDDNRFKPTNKGEEEFYYPFYLKSDRANGEILEEKRLNAFFKEVSEYFDFEGI